MTVCGRWVGRDGGERTQQETLADRGARVGRDVRLSVGWLRHRHCRQAGSGMLAAGSGARLNWVSQGQRWGRCRVRRRAERVSRPASPKKRRLRGLVGHDLRTQADPRRPAGQVVGDYLCRQPSAVGGETAGRHVVQPGAVLVLLRSYFILRSSLTLTGMPRRQSKPRSRGRPTRTWFGWCQPS